MYTKAMEDVSMGRGGGGGVVLPGGQMTNMGKGFAWGTGIGGNFDTWNFETWTFLIYQFNLLNGKSDF